MIKKPKKKYCLTWLDNNLKNSGLAAKCREYKISADKTEIRITYLNWEPREEFITIHRTSLRCFQIYHNGRKDYAKSTKQATSILSELLARYLSIAKELEVMTVSEYINSEYINFDYSNFKKRLEISTRHKQG